MKKRIILSVALFLSCQLSFGQEFKDARDNKTYTTKEINGVTWMTQNLQYKFKSKLEAVNVYNDSITAKKNKEGYFYAIADFSAVIPEGWRLPTMADVKKLYEKHSANPTAMFPSSAGAPFVDKTEGGTNETGFSIKKEGAINLKKYTSWKKQQSQAKNASNSSYDAFSSAIDNAEKTTHIPKDNSKSGWYCKDDYGDVVYFYYYNKTNKMEVASSSRNMSSAFHLRLVKK
jgi:uncharacterized protein (TIGR02145 family)